MQPSVQHLSRRYPSDVTDEQWELLAPWFEPKPRQPGRKPVVSRRRIVNAIFYVLREGCRWRSLPHDYPDWRLVYFYFTLWSQRGVFAEVYEALHRAERERQGRDPHPSAGVLDSQSVKTSAVARETCGYDAGKKGEGA
jgi:transposase